MSESLDRAELFIENGIADRALPLIASHLREHPDDPRAIRLMASGLLETDQVVEATDWSERAVASSPHDLEAWVQLGRAYLAGERAPDAKRTAREIIRLEPDLFIGHLFAAAADVMAEKVTAESAEHSSLAIALEPGLAISHAVHGSVLVGLKQRSAARASYREALRLDPESTEALKGLAALSLLRGNLGGAGGTFLDALNRDVHDEAALVGVQAIGLLLTIAVHFLLWIVWVVATISHLSIFGREFAVSEGAVSLRWWLAITTVVGVGIFLLVVTVASRGRLQLLLRASLISGRTMVVSLAMLVLTVVIMFAAAAAPGQIARLVYGLAFVPLIIDTIIVSKAAKALPSDDA